MKKLTINILILFLIDFVLIFNFYLLDFIEGNEIYYLNKNVEWKTDVGGFFIVLVITFFLVKEIIKLFVFIVKTRKGSKG